MTGRAAAVPGTGQALVPATVVWIDSREALILRWNDGAASIERIESEVPAHRKSTGHVAHSPSIRHGGGGSSQTADEPHRHEHMTRFIQAVGGHLPADERLVILGPGTVRDALERSLRVDDARHHRARSVSAEPAPRLTPRRLVERLRDENGAPAGRTPVGPGPGSA
jgi:hypothetical protein